MCWGGGGSEGSWGGGVVWINYAVSLLLLTIVELCK